MAATAPASGSVTIESDGTLTYTPRAGFNGTDTFTYTIEDGAGGTATATVTVTVTNIPNRAPIARPDSATTALGTPVVIPVLANDSDPDGDPLTVVQVIPASDPLGTAVVNPDGTITYTPSSGGRRPHRFDYEITDGRGGYARASVTVMIR